jgi:predicted glycosyltransferase
MLTNGRSRRILIYSHDSFGLGNIRRMLAIAEHLADSDPDTSVLMVSGSPMLHSFRMKSRIDYMKLPGLARTVDGSYVAKHLKIQYRKLIELRSNLILSAIMHFEPDLILVDKKPLGVNNELAPALNFAKTLHNPPKLALLLRDILDTPDTVCAAWQTNRYYEAIDEIYDSIMIVGSPEVFDARREYRFTPAACTKTQYCGYIKHKSGLRKPESVRESLGVGENPLVFITAGGGEDDFQIFNHYLQGLDFLKDQRRLHSVLLCGPEMAPEKRKLIAAKAAQFKYVHVEEFTNDVISLMNAADVIVSMGGYNTICEILSLRKRAIIVPRTKPVQEQWIRAQRMESLGLLKTIHPDRLSPRVLIDALEQELSMTNVLPKSFYQIDLGALPRIHTTIDDLLQSIPDETSVTEKAVALFS